MGLFDFLKKKEPEPSLPSSIETTAVVSQKQPTLRLHEDLRGLVWIADGIFKNYLLAFSDNLFLICYFSFDIPLKPKDIMRMAKNIRVHKRELY